MTSPMPTVAVVILNYNGSQHLRTFLPSVLNTSYPKAHLYVADNGSNDDSLPVLQKEFPQFRIIKMPVNLGFAGGYNEALKDLEEDYLVLLNSDVEVKKDWLEPMVKAMSKNPALGICQPKILSYLDKEKFEYAGAAGGWVDGLVYPFCRGRIFDTVEEDQEQYDTNEEIFWASGCALLIRQKLYAQLEGLDADYFAHMEEIDLCWRVKRAGYQVMVCPESTVYHLGGGTLEYNNPRKTFLNFRNSLSTLVKNEKGSAIFWKLPARLILDGVAGLRFLSQGQWNQVGAIIRAHWAFFGQLAKVLKKRKHYKRLISTVSIGPANVKSGRYSGSILWAYFIRGKKHFKNL